MCVGMYGYMCMWICVDMGVCVMLTTLLEEWTKHV